MDGQVPECDDRSILRKTMAVKDARVRGPVSDCQRALDRACLAGLLYGQPKVSRGLSRTARIACIATAVLAVFAVLVEVGSYSAGIAFFFSLPVGLAAWWFGPRAGLSAALACIALFALGDLVNPVPEFALAL